MFRSSMRSSSGSSLFTSVVTVMTGLLITSERSHYFRKSYLEERGLTSTKSYADRLTEIRLKIP